MSKEIKTIAILMATYNGALYLKEQLDSIISQTYSHWNLYILDDGSNDKTWEILVEYQNKLGDKKIKLFKQTNQGSSKTFLTLVCNNDIQADYYAYADQDDIWDNNKIEKAIAILEKQPSILPLLYCSTARLIDKHGKLIGIFNNKQRKYDFSHSLARNIAPGNTMVFNHVTRNILQAAGVVNVPVHDWWTAIVVKGCSGHIYKEDIPTISYRQHENNLIGNDDSLNKYWRKISFILKGKLKLWNEQHIAALSKINNYLPTKEQQIFETFKKAHEGSIFTRFYYLNKSKVYSNSIKLYMKAYLALLLGKI